MKAALFLCSILLVTVVICQQVAIPDLAQSLKANVQVTIPLFGTVPGILYFDYNNLVQRVDTQSPFGTVIDVSRYDLGKEYQIAGGQCSMKDLEGDMYPMAIPPFAIYKGTQNVNNIECDVFYIDLGSVEMSYYVTNETVQDKTESRIVRFFASVGGFDTQFDYQSVTPGPQDPSLFDITQWNCPPPQPPVTYYVNGYLMNALNKNVIAGATVTINETGMSATTDNNGVFSFTTLTPGTYTLVGSASGYFTGSQVVDLSHSIDAGSVADFTLSPVLQNGQRRAILDWATYPRDLDSHLKTPGCEVYYRQRGCQGAGYSATLDIDQTQGFGPETITILGNSQSVNLTYYVYVYSQGDFTTANARVRLYDSNGLALVLYAPTNVPNGKTWNVFNIGTDNSINVVNTIGA